MWALLVIRSVLGALARSPTAWLVAALMGAAWWALEELLPLGLSTDGIHRSSAHFEVAFIGGAAGIAIALRELRGLDHVLRPSPPMQRAIVEVTAMVTCAAILGSFAVIPALAFDTWQLANFDAVASTFGLLVGWGHIASLATLGLWLRRADAAVAALVALLVTLIVPGLLVGEGWIDGGLLRILDAGALLRATFDVPLNSAQLAWALVPIFGWTCLRAATLSPESR